MCRKLTAILSQHASPVCTQASLIWQSCRFDTWQFSSNWLWANILTIETTSKRNFFAVWSLLQASSSSDQLGPHWANCKFFFDTHVSIFSPKAMFKMLVIKTRGCNIEEENRSYTVGSFSFFVFWSSSTFPPKNLTATIWPQKQSYLILYTIGLNLVYSWILSNYGCVAPPACDQSI